MTDSGRETELEGGFVLSVGKGLALSGVQCVCVFIKWLHKCSSAVVSRGGCRMFLTSEVEYSMIVHPLSFWKDWIRLLLGLYNLNLSANFAVCYLQEVVQKLTPLQELEVVVRELLPVLTPRLPLLRLEKKICAACVRSVILYGSETWAVKE